MTKPPKLENCWITCLIDNPRFEDAGKVHDWRNYISKEIQEAWLTFTTVQREMLIRQADEMAGQEEWD